MKQVFAIVIFSLAVGMQASFAQYDYDDNDLKKPPKTPKEEKEEKEEKVAKRSDGKGFDLSKMAIGGIFNFSYGSGYYDGRYEYSNILYLEISPIVTYRLIEERLDIGTGVIYQFQKFDARDTYASFASQKYTYNTYGGRIFPRVYIWEGLFAQLEYVVLNGDVTVFDAQNNYAPRDTRMTFHNVFAGGGYSFPLGGAGYFALLMYVNLNTNALYPERRPFFSFGFGIGL